MLVKIRRRSEAGPTVDRPRISELPRNYSDKSAFEGVVLDIQAAMTSQEIDAIHYESKTPASLTAGLADKPAGKLTTEEAAMLIMNFGQSMISSGDSSKLCSMIERSEEVAKYVAINHPDLVSDKEVLKSLLKYDSVTMYLLTTLVNGRRTVFENSDCGGRLFFDLCSAAVRRKDSALYFAENYDAFKAVYKKFPYNVKYTSLEGYLIKAAFNHEEAALYLADNWTQFIIKGMTDSDKANLVIKYPNLAKFLAIYKPGDFLSDYGFAYFSISVHPQILSYLALNNPGALFEHPRAFMCLLAGAYVPQYSGFDHHIQKAKAERDAVFAKVVLYLSQNYTDELAGVKKDYDGDTALHVICRNYPAAREYLRSNREATLLETVNGGGENALWDAIRE